MMPRRCRSIGMAAAAMLCMPVTLRAAGGSALQPTFDEDHKERINGTMLHFRVRGVDKRNPYIVILHGGPGFSAHMFYPWGPSIEPSLNVVYLDQRGCGESARYKFHSQYVPRPAEIRDLTVANMVRDIDGVRDYLRVNRWFVLGHSWGGMLGVEYVAAFPERVIGFIDMDGAISFGKLQDDVLANCITKFTEQAKSGSANDRDQGQQLLEQTRKIQAIRPSDPLRLFNALALALGPAGLYFAGDQPKTFAAMTAAIQEATRPYHLAPVSLTQSTEPTVALIINDGLTTRDVTPLLPRITAPTLVVNGDLDGVVTPAMARSANQGIKGSTLLVLDNCGHFPFVDQPAKTTTAVLNFVNALSTPRQ